MRLLKDMKNKKEIIILFFVLLVPNILRQLIYYNAYLKTGTTSFIASFETQAIFSSNMLWLGVGEEIIIGVLYVLLWFSWDKFKLLGYGWIGDAFIDFIFVGSWFVFGSTPLQMLRLGSVARFALREVVLSYGLIGVLLYRRKANIRKVSFVITLAGLLVLLLI